MYLGTTWILSGTLFPRWTQVVKHFYISTSDSGRRDFISSSVPTWKNKRSQLITISHKFSWDQSEPHSSQLGGF